MAQQSLQEILCELREFRVNKPQHDLTALNAARARRFSRHYPQTLEETEKPAKRNKRKVADDE